MRCGLRDHSRLYAATFVSRKCFFQKLTESGVRGIRPGRWQKRRVQIAERSRAQGPQRVSGGRGKRCGAFEKYETRLARARVT